MARIGTKQTQAFVGAAIPTATDDSSRGFIEGNLWAYGGDVYLCASSALNAAVWIKVTSGGGGDTYWNRYTTPINFLAPVTALDHIATNETGRYKHFSNAAFNNLKANASPKVVTVGNYHCDFVTIGDALGSISDASATNPYTISLETQSYTQVGGFNFTEEFVNFDGEFSQFSTRISLYKNSYAHIGATFSLGGVGPALYFNSGNAADETYASAENISLGAGDESCVSCQNGILALRANKLQITATSGIAMCYGWAGFNQGITIATSNFIEPISNGAAHAYGFYHDCGTAYHNFNAVISKGTTNNNTGFAGLTGVYVPQKSYIFGNYLGGKQSFHLTGGKNVIMTNACISEGGVASVISSGTENYLITNRLEGGLTISTGASVVGIVNAPTGTLTFSDRSQFRGIWGDRIYGYNIFQMSGINPYWSIYNDTVTFNKKLFQVSIDHDGLPNTTYTNRPAAIILVANIESPPTEALPGICMVDKTSTMFWGADPSGNTFHPGNAFDAINAFYSGGFKVGLTGYAHVNKHDIVANNYQSLISASNVANSSLVQYKVVSYTNNKVSIKHSALYNLDSLAGRVSLPYNTVVDIGVKAFWGLFLVVIESTPTTPLYRGVGLMSGYPADTITTISADLITNFTGQAGQDTAGKINIYVDTDTRLITVKNKIPSATLYIRASCILGHPFQF